MHRGVQRQILRRRFLLLLFFSFYSLSFSFLPTVSARGIPPREKGTPLSVAKANAHASFSIYDSRCSLALAYTPTFYSHASDYLQDFDRPVLSLSLSLVRLFEQNLDGPRGRTEEEERVSFFFIFYVCSRAPREVIGRPLESLGLCRCYK